MDDFTTQDYKIECSNCLKQFCYFYSNDGAKVCQKCLCDLKYHGHWQVGGGSYRPCLKCTPPKIKWFYSATYGKIYTTCKTHDETLKKEGDFDPVFDSSCLFE